MKTVNVLLIVLASLLLFSCGESSNKVKSSSGYTDGYGRNPVTDFGTAEQNQYVDEVRSQYSCRTGSSRLPDITFSTTQIVSQTSISGTPMNTGVISGSVAQVYAGVSDYGDLMFVTKMTDGYTTTGFNVTVSFCSHGNLLIPERAIREFYASRITFNDSSYCGRPTVLAASNTQAVVEAYTYTDGGYQVQLPQEVALTTFLPVCY